MSSELKLRTARAQITPEESYPLGGFAGRTGSARGVARPLEANVVMLSTSLGRVVWITLDALAVTPSLRQAVVEEVTSACGYSAEEIVVVASHTHAAPAVWHGTIHPVLPAIFDQSAARTVAEKIAAALLGAPERCVRAYFGEGEVVGVGSNRHSPDGPMDHGLGALLLADATSDEPLAMVFDYACHPTVLGEDNLLYSPDWVGGARDAIRSRLGADVVVAYLPGAGGDVSTRFLRRERTHEEADRLGAIVGTAALEALAQALVLDTPMVSVERRVFLAPTRTSFDDPVTSPGTRDHSARVAVSLSDGAASRSAYLAADVPPALGVPLALVRVGSRRWIHTPFELGAVLAHQILAGASATRFIGYTDAYDGYLADADSIAAGHYEALASFFDPPTTTAIVERMAQERAGMSTASS